MSRRNRWGMIALACLGATGCVRSLTVAREETVAFNSGDAQNILAQMSMVLAQRDGGGDFACAADFQPELDALASRPPEEQRAVEAEVAARGGMLSAGAQNLLFLMDGGLQSFQGPRDIMTPEDFIEVASKPAFVKVVGSIHRCGRTTPMAMTRIIGCTQMDQRNGIVVVDVDDGRGGPNARLGGVLWAHEYGHSVGLFDESGQPADVMNGRIDENSRRITREDCMAYTRAIDANGPDGNLLDPDVPVLPGGDMARRPADMPVETFVRQTHVHGLGYAIKDDFDARDVDPLLRMLADPAEAAHREKIVALLGLVHGEDVGAVLVAHVEEMRAGRMDWDRSDELTSALLGLGALANHNQSSAVVERLQSWADPLHWSPENAELGRHIQVTALMALAMSGMPQARDTLGWWSANGNDPALRKNLDEILAMSETVAARGLDAYMRGTDN